MFRLRVEGSSCHFSGSTSGIVRECIHWPVRHHTSTRIEDRWVGWISCVIGAISHENAICPLLTSKNLTFARASSARRDGGCIAGDAGHPNYLRSSGAQSPRWLDVGKANRDSCPVYWLHSPSITIQLQSFVGASFEINVNDLALLQQGMSLEMLEVRLNAMCYLCTQGCVRRLPLEHVAEAAATVSTSATA
jgi:hypothetical protein